MKAYANEFRNKKILKSREKDVDLHKNQEKKTGLSALQIQCSYHFHWNSSST